jgi:tripartite-type tricarboxylate transporter receptor subunit TctC
MHRRSLIRSAAAAGLLPGAARAQAFPSKQLRLLVGAAAGGGADIVARILAQELTKSGGLSVIVDNKPGAGGTVATREALRAPADGYTLLVANVGVLAVIPYATKDAGYDPRADIAAVCMAVDFPNVLVVHPAVPAKTLADYLALARRPEGMDYGTAGVGTAGHLAGELLRALSGARLNHVPFRGGGPAMNDLLGGHVPSLFASAPTATGVMREGRIRALAVTSAKRSPALPDVPTMAEAGLHDQEAETILPILVPAATPKPIIDLLYGEIASIIALPETQQTLATLGFDPLVSTPEQSAVRVKEELARWAKVIRDAKIEPQ